MLKFTSDLGVDGLLVSYLEKSGEACENWTEVGVNLIETFSVIEDIVSQHHRFPDIKLEIDCKNILSDYLYKKYNFNNSYSYLPSTWCNGGDEEFYINSDGSLFPCRQANSSISSIARELGLYVHDNIPNLITNDSNVIKSNSYLLNFYNFSRNIDTYINAKDCHTCEFYYKCKPCPFKCQTHFVNYECKYARKLLSDLDTYTLSSIFNTSTNIRKSTLNINKIHLLNFITQEELILENIEKHLWELLESNVDKSLSDIISILHSKYKLDISLTSFRYDILNYTYELINRGLLYKH